MSVDSWWATKQSAGGKFMITVESHQETTAVFAEPLSRVIMVMAS